MSCEGTAIGNPFAGSRMFCVESIRTRASACASGLRGTCTAIWSPSKSALNAAHTSGCTCIALPSTSTGSKAWMPRRWRVGARFRSTGCSLMTSSSTSQTSGLRRSTICLALRMFGASALSTRTFMTNGLKSSTAMRRGRPHWCILRPGPTLLALEHVGEALERPVAGARDGAAAAPVIEESVHGLLEHPLLVVHDHVRSPEVEQAPEPVVPVYHAPVKIIQIARGEAPAVELDHRTQIRRQDGDGVHDHPLGAVAAGAEGVHDLQALYGLLALLATRLVDYVAQILGLLIEVDLGYEVPYGL